MALQDTAGLEPVTDPALIALLEQPQSAINKGGETQTPEEIERQRRQDIFEADNMLSTIEDARKLSSGWSTGFWGKRFKGWGGTDADDLQSKVNTLQANLSFDELARMRQASPTGGALGAISERELQLLGSTVASLDTIQSEQEFEEALTRVEAHYRRFKLALNGIDPDAPGVDPDGFGEPPVAGRKKEPGAGVAAPPPGGPVEISETGEARFSTPRDQAFAAEAQAAFDGGASRVELDQMAVQAGYLPYGADLEEAIAYREKGGKGARIAVPESGYRGPSTMGALAATPVGAYFASAGNALTAGTLDEIIGATGGDQEQAQAAKEVMREAHPLASMAGEVTGAALGMTGIGRAPGLAGRALAGDVAYGAAYGAGEANENRLGGAAVGAGAAAAGSYFGGKLLDRLSNRTPRPAAQRVERAQKFGIDLPMGAAGRTGAVIEKGLDILPGSAGVMQQGRDILSDQVGEAVEGVADSFGVPASFSAMGEAAQRGARVWMSRFDEVTSKAYAAIPVSPKAPADLSNTRAMLENLTGRFQSNPKLAEAMSNTRLERYMDALGEQTSQLSWEDLKAFRSRIGEEIGDQRFSDGTLKSELRGLYAALSEDMKATAATQGPKALRAFERANTLYRQGQERIDNALTSLLGDDGKLAPEKAAAKLQQIARSGKSSSDIKRLADIRRSMPAEEWGEVSNGLIRLMGQPVNSAGREFSPETFIRTFDDMEPAAKNLFFGGENKVLRQNLEEFSGVMRDLAGNNALRNTSGTAGVTNIAALFSLLPTSLVSLPAAGALAAQTAGSYGLARLWTNPRFVRWATGYSKMLRGAAKAGAVPQPGNIAKHADLLKKIAAAEPAIAAETMGLRQALLGAANDNVSAAAADSGAQQEQRTQ